MLAHGASLAERRVVPSSNEKVVNQARPERGYVEHGALFRLRMSVHGEKRVLLRLRTGVGLFPV